MKHYSEHDISRFKERIKHNLHQYAETLNWVEAHLKYEDKNNLTLQLKTHQNTFNKIYNNIDSKPVIAVFGGSQVGKSYLIKNLLSRKGQPFVIKYNNEQFDFLKDINPPGVGAESTGVVTRFTIDNEQKFDKFPIKVKLLSVKDILIIILDSFYLDLKRINIFLSKKELELHLKYWESNYTGSKQNVLTEFDILEIKDYFENHLSKHTILFEGLIETRFFERIGVIINGVEPSDWFKVFDILWNRNEYLTALFEKLISNLKAIHFDASAFISFKEVLRGEGEILDVKRLKELNNSAKKTIVKRENGEEILIDLSFITALTTELIFSIPADLVEDKEFLKNSDLLDFPGARSRLAIDVEDIDSDIIPDMLLRGKVSYLFNKYSDDFNINNLLFCTNDKQLDVNEIPSLLFNWISKNIGSNASERNQALHQTFIPPLFVIFTFFNNQLKYDTTNDFEYAEDFNKLDYKWDTRFNRFFINEIVTQTKDWHVEWTSTQKFFKNFYLLRDFKYSTDTFDGYEDAGYELEVNKDRITFLQQLRESFLNFKFVQDHFEHPDRSWETSTSINEDGSELIIKNLALVSNNLAKTNYYLTKLNNLLERIKIDLNKHLHTDDLSVLRANSMKNVNELQFSFNSMLSKDLMSFNNFIKSSMLKPVEVYNLLNENIVVNVNEQSVSEFDESKILLAQYPELKNISSLEEAFHILKTNLWLSSNEEVESFLNQKGIKKEHLFVKKETKSRALFFTDLVLNYWKTKITDVGNFDVFISNGVSNSNLAFLSDHWIRILDQRKIKNKLEKILNEIISETTTNRGIEEFLAETFSLIVNEIVINFDLQYFTSDELEEINKLQNSNFKYFQSNKLITSEHIQRLFENNKNETTTAYEVALEKYNKWIEFFRISLLVNCGFVNYDENANNSLKELVSSFETIN